MGKFNKRLLCGILALLLLLAGCGTLPEAPQPTSTEAIRTEETSAPTAQATEGTTTPAPAPTEATPQPTLPAGDSSFSIHFIDVGQADAALVLCDGKSMLIDGGNAEDSNLLYTYLKKHSIPHLDYVIGTHAHEDHIGGLAGALNFASVDKAFCPVTTYDSKAFLNFVKALSKHGVDITVPSVGERFPLGSAQCTVLAVNTDTSDPNNSSIVLRIVYGETSFLFTGDAETPVEQAVLNSGTDIRSTVLKVGHHGSDSSTGYLWLREISPQFAVISVGKGNTYGHPTETVLSRLRDADITTFRTDLQGDILCTSDGKAVSISVTRNPNADVFGNIGENSVQPTDPPETEPVQTEPPETEPPAPVVPEDTGRDYAVNTNTGKFHYPSCSSAKQIKESNRWDYHGTRDALIGMNYVPCKRCNP